MKRAGYCWLTATLLWLSFVAQAQEQPIEDYVEAVTAYLQQETGETPQPQEIVGMPHRLVVKVYQDGDYRTGLTIAEQTYRFAEQALGPEHPNTLSSVNNLAGLYRAQGRYGEAEPLYQRALAASEKVLGPKHPDTLALAGANQGLRGQLGPNGEDGILYALEVQGLNLEDTELVALSACDTGVGTLDYSEGVYGLVRAFRIAGARHVLMSLWKLGDASARDFMVRFYRTWLDGSKPKDMAVALRQTQLAFIEDNDEGRRDPRVWAPFVLVETR